MIKVSALAKTNPAQENGTGIVSESRRTVRRQSRVSLYVDEEGELWTCELWPTPIGWGGRGLGRSGPEVNWSTICHSRGVFADFSVCLTNNYADWKENIFVLVLAFSFWTHSNLSVVCTKAGERKSPNRTVTDSFWLIEIYFEQNTMLYNDKETNKELINSVRFKKEWEDVKTYYIILD